MEPRLVTGVMTSRLTDAKIVSTLGLNGLIGISEKRVQKFWCPWPESNQHSLRNSILSRARLPIPPQGLSDAAGRADVAKRAEYSGR